jgi:hypothetical protein
MLRRKIAVAACTVLLLSGLGSPVLAAGLGFYAEGSGGSGTFTYDTWDEENEESFDMDVSAAGAGFLVDTNPYGGKTFSYRLGLGYERLTWTDDGGAGTGDVDLDAIVMNNGFNFAVARGKRFRVWLGPQLRLGYFSGETDQDMSRGGRQGEKQTAWAAGIGLGIGVGGQVLLSNSFGLGLEVGARYMGYAGRTELYDESDDFTARHASGYLNLSFLFGR